MLPNDAYINRHRATTHSEITHDLFHCALVVDIGFWDSGDQSYVGCGG